MAVVAFLACAAGLLTGSRAAGEVMRHPLRVLQMNLCGSGLAGCYTGWSVTEAAAVIRAHVPDLVTLNEVCEDHVDVLGQTLVDVSRGGAVVRAFKAAGDRRTAGGFRCRNGQLYGIGLLARIPAPYRGFTTYSGIYPAQDTGDPEERAWLCVHAAAAFYACTTHLANTNPTVTLAQCRYLLDTAIAAVRARGGYEPTVLGGDLNLSYGGSPDVRSCVPPGYLREDDGAVQHIVATTDFTVRSNILIDMDGMTDHPGLLIALAVGEARATTSRPEIFPCSIWDTRPLVTPWASSSCLPASIASSPPARWTCSARMSFHRHVAAHRWPPSSCASSSFR